MDVVDKLNEIAAGAEPAFEWLVQPSVVRPLLARLRLGVAWQPGWDALGDGPDLRKAVVEAWAKAHLGKGEEPSAENYVRRCLAHAAKNDALWAGSVAWGVPGAPYSAPVCPRGREPDICVSVEVTTDVVERARVYSRRVYAGEVSLDRGTVFDYLAEGDIDGLADYLNDAINNQYSELDYETDEQDVETDDIVDETIRRFPDCNDLANDLDCDYGEDARPEPEEEEEEE